MKCCKHQSFRTSTSSSLLLLLLLSFVYSTSAFSTMASSSSSSSSSSARQQHEYPRPLHPGGFTFPPLVEDRLPIITSTKSSIPNEDVVEEGENILQTDILLVKPPDMESLWEWYAYTKHQSECDPSWGRVWPTALSLARWVLRSLHHEENAVAADEKGDDSTSEKEEDADDSTMLLEQATQALRTASHVVEVGCGLGVAGLAYASFLNDNIQSNDAQSNQRGGGQTRTITFLDREPYALHCVMASAATNGFVTSAISPPANRSNSDETEEASDAEKNATPSSAVTVRAAMDDWTLPPTTDDATNNDETTDGKTKNAASSIKNMCYQDLHCSNQSTLLVASDILYEPSSMTSLAQKLQRLLHPQNGGYALIADPKVERTTGCRDAFIQSVERLGGRVVMVPMPELQSDQMFGTRMRMNNGNNGRMMLLEGDVDIDGSLAEVVLLVVHFHKSSSGL